MNRHSSRSSQSSSASHRIFYNIPEKADGRNDEYEKLMDIFGSTANNETILTSNSETYYTPLFDYINKNIIGKNIFLNGPFGSRSIVYCDYTASGRSLKFIEEFIYNEVLPEYANTHTTNTATSLQTTMFRHEARDIIKMSCNVSDRDAVLFIGSGCTGAIHKLIHNLHLIKPPIVIVGPFEHHSNLLPWRHLAHMVFRVNINEEGSVDLNQLKEILIEQVNVAKNDHRPILGVFAAVSNVTGFISDVDSISAIVHHFGGFVFWDYAAGAPYVPIDMNPIKAGTDPESISKDAVYFSIHKFIGGVQAPGILIAKKSLFVNGEEHPDGAGGGTVFFVRRNNQIYLKDVEDREEGGTPDIVGSIRAGLVFQLKESAGSSAIMDREDYLVKLSWSKFAKASSNLIILGGTKTHRIPIFSFLIRHEVSKGDYLFLHHNFVCSLLNDLFGIQSRSGCACAGPYAMDLLGIDEELAKRFEDALIGSEMSSTVLSKYFESPHREILRPGFVRINFPYFMTDNEVNFVLDAICFVAKHGYKFLTCYNFNSVTSEWRYRDYELFRCKKWLSHVSYRHGYMTWRRPNKKELKDFPSNFTETMGLVNKQMKNIVDNPVDISDEGLGFDESTQTLRWFLLPSEVATILWNAPKITKSSKALFSPGSIARIFCAKEENHGFLATANTDPEPNEAVEQFKECTEVAQLPVCNEMNPRASTL